MAEIDVTAKQGTPFWRKAYSRRQKGMHCGACDTGILKVQPIMTPEEIMSDFNVAGVRHLPRRTIMAARNHRLEVIPLFLAYIDEIRTLHKNLPEDRQSAFLYVIHLLAEWREARAYAPLCEVMRLDEQTIRRVFEDGLHETSWRTIFSVFDGDINPVVRVINDADAFHFARVAMIQALTAIALQYPDTRTAALAVLRDFYDRFHEQDRGKGDIVWDAWANSIIDLGAEDFSPLVRTAFDAGNMPSFLMEYEDFLQYLDYTTGKQTAPVDFRSEYDNCAIDDTIEELSSWYCFSEEFIRQETRREQATHDPMSQNRFGMNKIGRNAPCPCGSGRKFKKCCLLSQQAGFSRNAGAAPR